MEILVPSEVLPFPRFNLKFSSKFCGLPVPGFRSKERKIYRYFVHGTTGFDTKKKSVPFIEKCSPKFSIQIVSSL